jgi:hypothetical protein
MGSLPEGTLCSYCGVREAGYIPDGAAGAICFEPDGECCWGRGVALGRDVIVQERQMRLVGSENSSGTASSTAAEQQSVAANGAPTPIPTTDAGQPSVSASVANKSTVAASGASIAIQQALGISAEEPRTKRQNNGSSVYQGPTCFQIDSYAQSGSGSLSESELPLLVEVEPWELERCQCPIGVPPLDRVIEGESRLRCFQCLRPYEESKASGSLSGSDLIEGTKEQHVMMIEATEVHGNFIRQSVVYGNNAVARD